MTISEDKIFPALEDALQALQYGHQLICQAIKGETLDPYALELYYQYGVDLRAHVHERNECLEDFLNYACGVDNFDSKITQSPRAKPSTDQTPTDQPKN
jgi:hypothetical protein